MFSHQFPSSLGNVRLSVPPASGFTISNAFQSILFFRVCKNQKYARPPRRNWSFCTLALLAATGPTREKKSNLEHIVSLFGAAAAVFTSTNVDDVFVLLGFFSDSKFRGRQVVIGQYFGIATLYGVSVVASLASLVIPTAYIGLLGLAPIMIGLRKVWSLRNGVDASEEKTRAQGPSFAGRANIAAVAAVTIANGGDNISIYTPLFATRSGYDIAAIGGVFAAMTFVWLLVARWLVHHRTIGAPLRRYGGHVVPFVLIALGFYILYDSGTFGLLRAAR
jgi:cadmium resistance protein CadD (predicted permease)